MSQRAVMSAQRDDVVTFPLTLRNRFEEPANSWSPFQELIACTALAETAAGRARDTLWYDLEPRRGESVWP